MEIIPNIRNFLKGHTDSLTLLSCHPRNSATWYWYVDFQKYRPGFKRHFFKISLEPFQRKGQWHHRLHLFWLGYFVMGFQDYHKTKQHQQ